MLTRKCRRCSQKTTLSEDEINKMVDEITQMKSIRLVSDSEYDRRFNVCRNCASFLYGSTCGKCGCVMQVRARLTDGRCPDRKWY